MDITTCNKVATLVQVQFGSSLIFAMANFKPQHYTFKIMKEDAKWLLNMTEYTHSFFFLLSFDRYMAQ